MRTTTAVKRIPMRAPVGRYRLLRRTRLDELPRIYNILIGEMSFVGPSVVPVDRSSAFAARLLVRPASRLDPGVGRPQIGALTALDVWCGATRRSGSDLKILGRTRQ
jgi:lipopolysaccharide/colanic/teichoic acid biosynthesis glycosyltransferase